ncbi:hypothetical protein [Flavobacterium daemonense]|uniref:hypothetical protein n=1 Tax=Flavobacterium daemonense TaxID=1393049 RepID=UPI0013A60F67|nr:hypothetical protein [Flavobacterium daemonense]KAF2335459.1 hypothetical protein FND99_04675 [Flavobacterium daemonense]
MTNLIKLNMTFKVVLMSLSASFGLVMQQISKTFGREISVVDKEVVDVILSNPLNKQKLLTKLNESNDSSIQIKIEGDKFSFVE